MVTIAPASLHAFLPDESTLGEAPLVWPLPESIELSDAFLRLCQLPHCVWLDSAKQIGTLGRYSFLTADPLEFVAADKACADPLGLLGKHQALLQQKPLAGLPPFQGGICGVLGYDLCRTLEPIEAAKHDDLPTPPIAFGLYDWTICYDHQCRQGWIISQGWPSPIRKDVVLKRRND
ncbi:MAG: hypothetical protein R3C05_12190 [Pirellulaceae bacterium]